ncbi:sensor domain-containing phosphodiesterase [Arthrobacter livingstonensis]|uniref:sensor domain-containing phosphodiesterase n=1 Tax=Arthrobacter livingstonensis TaxID=670078 RepID=UPI001B870768|nr:EAL domain-containing protein [Arthrobacter livingstonensis]
MLGVGVESGVALALRLPALFAHDVFSGTDVSVWLADFLVLLLVPVAFFSLWRLERRRRREKLQETRASQLVQTVLDTSREWLWSVGPDGSFTFCGASSQELTGYSPAELLGRPFSMVMDPGDLAEALTARKAADKPDASWEGLITVCRHRDGSRVLVEVTGKALNDASGQPAGFAGTARPLESESSHVPGSPEIETRIKAVLNDRALRTAFQPIRSLENGSIHGAEALTRFNSSPDESPETWFLEATSVGLGVDLEFLALETALAAAARVPAPLYVALNLSPLACLDPRLGSLLQASAIPTGRIVLEITERHQVQDYEPLAAALAPLRCSGLRIAVDDAGAGYASMRHILQLRPALIKLDREIIAGIDTNQAQQALVSAMVSFASDINAALVAEGIETDAEQHTLTRLGITLGQGYLLGRPSITPTDWAQWHNPPRPKEKPPSPTDPHIFK